MRIRYQSLHGVQNLTIGHALGGTYGEWSNGQERDVPDDEKVWWQTQQGTRVVVKAVDALLSCGPEFVDAATGTNPDFACKDCGATTNAEGFMGPQGYTAYENEHGDRLCIACFLKTHPQHELRHEQRGLSPAVLDLARKRREEAGIPAAPTVPPVPLPVIESPPPANPEKEAV